MQLDTSLYGPFYYAIYPLIIVILLIIITIIVFLCFNLKKKSKKNAIPIVVIPKDIYSIKQKYLMELDHLSKNNTISKRKVFNILSNIMRRFVLEVTNIDVLKYSLEEIKVLNIPSLTSLVAEYYEPEFSEKSNGDPIASINRTKEVIQKWK